MQQADQYSGQTNNALAASLEAALLGLWLSVLEVDRVERNDDFFLAGGDSLRGSRLIAHVRTVFEVELTHEDLFGRASSSASMAELISARRSGIDSQAVLDLHNPKVRVVRGLLGSGHYLEIEGTNHAPRVVRLK